MIFDCETIPEYHLNGGLSLAHEYRRDATSAQQLSGTPTKFRLRRIELQEGQEVMLFKQGWAFEGPDKHHDTELGRYWVNPRSGRRYTKQCAVDIEELREAGDYDAKNGPQSFALRDMKHVRKYRKKRELCSSERPLKINTIKS